MKQRILVVEDEIQIATILKIELEYEGYEVLLAHTGKSGLEAALQEKLDLVLLDVMLPELNGIEVLRRIRNENSLLPIILLTARNITMDKVAGLDQGANDYITKPFEIDELLARIRSAIRHNSITANALREEETILSIKDLFINLDTREVKRGDSSIALTPKEFDLLIYLLSNKNKIVTRENILMNVWGYEYEGETNVIDVYIRHLRKKTEEGFSDPTIIQTVRGIGYTVREK
ncbi:MULTISPECIES: response regulator transcription factor [Peribacillus]|uniref:response regulator transcription factor n=1 Tax=Peribacillus TaxID=2675229 RepID=UPI000B76786B|nr:MULTISPECIES: response regulator transcription factor [Peribacillus]MDF9759310.1 DNA-binding response OmpR family regulator [Peribacillus simplex]MDV7764914.1 response regulator transcription factor [Peribacillus sp. CSMR9]SNT09098.1 DNA-binding response regulator, OmpR family, contains REC and winged-helix (wHTH) domain [Bacillus sp. OK838]